MTSKKQTNTKAPGTLGGSYQGSQASGSREAGSTYLEGRRSLAYELVESGGLAESRLGLEILFLLPDEFITFYTTLFNRAFQVAGGKSAMGNQAAMGGVGVAKGRTGTVLGSETRMQATGSGKRYKNTGLVIGDENALRIKAGVDRGLQELVGDAQRAFARARESEGSTGSSGGGLPRSTRPKGIPPTAPTQCQGLRPATSASPGGTRCGRFLKASWKFCPECGTVVAGVEPWRDT